MREAENREPEAGSGKPEAGSWRLSNAETDFTGGRHGVEDARDDLRGAGAPHFIGGLGLEQFGVRQDDSELVVEAMEQQTEVVRVVAGGAGSVFGGRHHEASLRVSSPVRPGSRQSVSTKIRTEPPAVRTYSTLPLAIQL